LERTYKKNIVSNFFSKLQKKLLLYNIFFHKKFFPNPKLQFICIKVDWGMEYSCFAATLILFAILFFFWSLLWFALQKYIIGSTLNLRRIGKILKKWWNMIKNFLIWEGPNPSSISVFIDNEQKIQKWHWFLFSILKESKICSL
jgi:hypothetical protein